MTLLVRNLRGRLVGVVLDPAEYRGLVDERRGERYRLDTAEEESPMVVDASRERTREELLAELEQLSQDALASLLAIARSVRKAPPVAGRRGAELEGAVAELGPISDDDAQAMLQASRECRRVSGDDW